MWKTPISRAEIFRLIESLHLVDGCLQILFSDRRGSAQHENKQRRHRGESSDACLVKEHHLLRPGVHFHVFVSRSLCLKGCHWHRHKPKDLQGGDGSTAIGFIETFS